MKNTLVNSCKKLVPGINFEEGVSFYWSPATTTIHYVKAELNSQNGQWALIHEVAHAYLNHKNYENDAGLLLLEVEAWETAKQISSKLDIPAIDEDHIQDCLNTYRDWLYARSTCPTCRLNSLQIDQTTYQCVNCSTRWSVTQSRFCRPYRMHNKHKKPTSEPIPTVFS